MSNIMIINIKLVQLYKKIIILSIMMMKLLIKKMMILELYIYVCFQKKDQLYKMIQIKKPLTYNILNSIIICLYFIIAASTNSLQSD